MEAVAFCPAHITGFFKAHTDIMQELESFGSMGAGFSIKEGVTTCVKVYPKTTQNGNFQIMIHGYQPDKTDVSEFVLNDFLERGNFDDLFFDIRHEITVPVGYGLGSSGAVALSLSLALNQALGTGLERITIGKIAHNAEINCKTGLGDILASYHGGFEIRTKPGAPGIGKLEKIDTEPVSVMVICFSPISTNKFIKEHLSKINGIGGKMVDRLLETKDYRHFQDMSLEFAEHAKVITPRMKKVIGELSGRQIKCGVALFGETVFTIVPQEMESSVLEVLGRYSDGVLIRSELDCTGARVLYN